ncbi:hypothetical protein LC085_11870 [Bacillus tianshenii]|uniref:hypothetical protein n=1 Tax=Sutcliffiella tianshenii TaxID=1463404 RepID=UPI001CD68A78|nr:hypothetical protein [Bacillus tianshenii]MCA1320609.1 hypothetical protein [Bacillus tianshenii]
MPKVRAKTPRVRAKLHRVDAQRIFPHKKLQQKQKTDKTPKRLVGFRKINK